MVKVSLHGLVADVLSHAIHDAMKCVIEEDAFVEYDSGCVVILPHPSPLPFSLSSPYPSPYPSPSHHVHHHSTIGI